MVFSFLKTILKELFGFIKKTLFENEHELMLHGPFVNTYKWYLLVMIFTAVLFAIYSTEKNIDLTMRLINAKEEIAKLETDRDKLRRELDKFKNEYNRCSIFMEFYENKLSSCLDMTTSEKSRLERDTKRTGMEK